MEFIKNNRIASLTAVTLIYVAATVLGVVIYFLLPFEFWLNLLIADVASTVFTYIFSLIFKNASVYDPYWSVQPMVILFAFFVLNKFSVSGLLLLVAVLFWGIRLTANWVYTFKGLGAYEDWRYKMLREKSGRLYQLVNFTGIHMVPTLVVYACVLPAVIVVREAPQYNVGSIVFFLICIVAASLELVSDITMHRFRKSGKGGFIRDGVWKYSRHPNYLGEITMWWGIGLAAVCVMPEKWWYLLIGALLNTILFLAASIPMAEKHQSRKEGFEEYKKHTRYLFPIPKK